MIFSYHRARNITDWDVVLFTAFVYVRFTYYSILEIQGCTAETFLLLYAIQWTWNVFTQYNVNVTHWKLISGEFIKVRLTFSI